MDIEVIERDELKKKLDRGDEFKLVMVLGDWAYRAKHIPGSLNITDPKVGLELLDPDDEIVVYCSNESCIASIAAYKLLKDRGYSDVRRYSGGLLDWEDAGYPLEGEMVEAV
ncbi:MAG: rhodanese-like domain-containing protein [Anaerolineales bacterium]|nr:rhodanese-like domain-containing protein [Anaerolineales bacterium]